MKKYTLKKLMQESSLGASESQMTQQRLESLIRNSQEYEVLEDEPGYLLFKYLGTKMALLCDEQHNRMRLISPITNYSSLAPKIKDSIMMANFQSALDARYGVWEDTLYTAFLHSLSSLHEDDFLSALKQVHNLAQSFGKTYSSAQIEFTKKK
jgi:hypothetical protein